MLRIFIGYDGREAVAYHTLCHSLHTRSTIPLQISPLNRGTLAEFYKRPRGQYDSTDFSITRFLVPFLCGYKGWALFIDSDMLCRTDIAELTEYICLRNWYKAILVAKHDYVPKGETKFLGELQTKYARKNWSSFMLFNNERCKRLTVDYVSTAPGLSLHRFDWLDDEQIGEIPLHWNWLVGEYEHNDQAKMVHFTLGGPYFKEYGDCDYAEEWRSEFNAMTSCAQRTA